MSSNIDEVYQFDDPQFDEIKCNQKDDICLTVQLPDWKSYLYVFFSQGKVIDF